MVHHPSFLYHFLHTLYDLDADKVVGKGKSEEYAFGFQILFFILNRFLPLPFRPFTFPLAVASCHQPVVFGFEVLGAGVLRAVRVLAEVPQEVYRVTPHGAVSDGVAVTDADFD